MLVNLYNFVFFFKRHFNEREIPDNVANDELRTQEGQKFEFSYTKSLWMTFINKDLDLSTEYVNKIEGNFLLRLLKKGGSLYTLKNILLHLFSVFHLVSYALVLFLVGWYFDIGEISNAGFYIIVLVCVSFVILFFEYRV